MVLLLPLSNPKAKYWIYAATILSHSLQMNRSENIPRFSKLYYRPEFHDHAGVSATSTWKDRLSVILVLLAVGNYKYECAVSSNSKKSIPNFIKISSVVIKLKVAGRLTDIPTNPTCFQFVHTMKRAHNNKSCLCFMFHGEGNVNSRRAIHSGKTKAIRQWKPPVKYIHDWREGSFYVS
jgi:hypothetical protein